MNKICYIVELYGIDFNLIKLIRCSKILPMIVHASIRLILSLVVMNYKVGLKFVEMLEFSSELIIHLAISSDLFIEIHSHCHKKYFTGG